MSHESSDAPEKPHVDLDNPERLQGLRTKNLRAYLFKQYDHLDRLVGTFGRLDLKARDIFSAGQMLVTKNKNTLKNSSIRTLARLKSVNKQWRRALRNSNLKHTDTHNALRALLQPSGICWKSAGQLCQIWSCTR